MDIPSGFVFRVRWVTLAGHGRSRLVTDCGVAGLDSRYGRSGLGNVWLALGNAAMASAPDRDRTDGVERKLGLLAAAYDAGRRDLAMSLTESIKDTLLFERMTD